MPGYRPVALSLVGLSALGVALLPQPEGTAASVMPALALTVLIIGLMATNSLPEYQTSALFFILALVLGIAPPAVVFSGLLSSAFWLVAGGVILGIAAQKTGLGRAVAEVFVRRLGRSYPRLIAGIVFGAVVLAFLIPAAIARMIILMPIVLALADRLGMEPGRKGRVGMALAVTIASFYMPMAILPSNFPNVLLAGLADGLYGEKITYGLYLLMHFPVAGILKGIVLVGLICMMFADHAEDGPIEQAPPPAPLSSEGRRMAFIVVLTVAAWASDFIHGVAPGWVAVAAAAVCLMPGLGVLAIADFKGKSGGFVALFSVATVISLGVVIATTGAGAFIAGKLFAVIEFKMGASAHAYGVFSAINILMSFFATLPGTIAVLAPFADTIADQSGLPLMTVLMVIANGYSTVFLPYQAPPILAGMRLGGVSLADGARLTLALSTVTVVLLLPLTFLWWRALGFIP
jgi:anion transporter